MTPYKAEFSTVGAQVATGKGDGSAYETVNAKYSQNLLYAGPTSKGKCFQRCEDICEQPVRDLL